MKSGWMVGMVFVAAMALVSPAHVAYSDHKPGHTKGNVSNDYAVSVEFLDCMEAMDSSDDCTDRTKTTITNDDGGPYTGKVFADGSGDMTINLHRSPRWIDIDLGTAEANSEQAGCPTTEGAQIAQFMNAKNIDDLFGDPPMWGISWTNLHFVLENTVDFRSGHVRVLFHSAIFDSKDEFLKCGDDNFANDFQVNTPKRTALAQVKHYIDNNKKRVWVLTPAPLTADPSAVCSLKKDEVPRASLSVWKGKSKCNGGQFAVLFNIVVTEK